MGRRQKLLGGLLALVALWAGLTLYLNRHWFTPASPHDIQIEVSGTPGLKVDATFEADGAVTQQSGTIPATFTVRARKLSYTITKGDQAGELSATVTVDGASLSRAGGTAKNVRGVIDGGNVTLSSADPN